MTLSAFRLASDVERGGAGAPEHDELGALVADDVAGQRDVRGGSTTSSPQFCDACAVPIA